jgi:hypothetical protein
VAQERPQLGTSGNRVEVARNVPGVIAVRDSKNPDGAALIFSPYQWQAFTAQVRAGTLTFG